MQDCEKEREKMFSRIRVVKFFHHHFAVLATCFYVPDPCGLRRRVDLVKEFVRRI